MHKCKRTYCRRQQLNGSSGGWRTSRYSGRSSALAVMSSANTWNTYGANSTTSCCSTGSNAANARDSRLTSVAASPFAALISAAVDSKR